MGADEDPRAPWNQPDYDYVDCEKCGGSGRLYYAIELETDKEVEVTQSAYLALPPTEELALSRGQRYYQGDFFPCGECEGKGYIEKR